MTQTPKKSRFFRHRLRKSHNCKSFTITKSTVEFEKIDGFKNGGVYPTLVEHPLTITRLYREKWLRDKFNIEQETLARLHCDEGLTIKELALRFKVSPSTIKVILYGLRAKKSKQAKSE